MDTMFLLRVAEEPSLQFTEKNRFHGFLHRSLEKMQFLNVFFLRSTIYSRPNTESMVS